MIGRKELDEYAETDRRATERADLGGKPPRLHPAHAAIFTAVGVFCLLDIFAAVTLPDRDAAFWPVVTFTAICSGGVATIQWRRGNAWWKRYRQAMSDIETVNRSRG